MIHNLHVSEVEVNTEQTVISTSLNFTIITEVGKIECKVILGKDLDNDGRPKAYASQYEVLGNRVTHNIPNGRSEKEGIRRLAHTFIDVCDANGWNAWSY